jgi:hypothetical protein
MIAPKFKEEVQKDKIIKVGNKKFRRWNFYTELKTKQ